MFIPQGRRADAEDRAAGADSRAGGTQNIKLAAKPRRKAFSRARPVCRRSWRTGPRARCTRVTLRVRECPIPQSRQATGGLGHGKNDVHRLGCPSGERDSGGVGLCAGAPAAGAAPVELPKLARWVQRLAAGGPVHVAYGRRAVRLSARVRALTRVGVRCTVVVPSLIPQGDGRAPPARSRRICATPWYLVTYLRQGLLSAVTVPEGLTRRYAESAVRRQAAAARRRAGPASGEQVAVAARPALDGDPPVEAGVSAVAAGPPVG